MVLILLLLAGAGDESDSGLSLGEDTSYRGFTRLKQVSAACEDDHILFRARTLGWSEEGVVEIWQPGGTPKYANEKLQTIVFAGDETCDILEATIPNDESGYSCARHDQGVLTYFVRIQFEVGCGGMRAWGGTMPVEDVYNQVVEPPPAGADCDLGDPGEYNPEDVMGEVVDEVTPCSVALPE